jgi:hypothetical protein
MQEGENIYRKAVREGLRRYLSEERFDRYLKWANADEEEAFRLYSLNTALSESLYTPLQMLEITLRNQIHRAMTEKFTVLWIDNESILDDLQKERIAKAKSDLLKSGKPVAPEDVVATLTFGFWTTLFNREHADLWNSVLHTIADDRGRKLSRKEMATPLNRIRALRNRIAHHEPVIHWNLRAHYAEILRMTGWLSGAAYNWSLHNSRFDHVYPKEGLDIKKPRVP